MHPLVPPGFIVPREPAFPTFRLEVLGPEHNERDHIAWMSSIDHIRATPGFEHHTWPTPLTLSQNLADLQLHADEFEQRVAFAWSILHPDSDGIIGCLYLQPTDPPRPGHARFRCWVTAAQAPRDRDIRDTLREWLTTHWPLEISESWPPKTGCHPLAN